LANSAAEAAVTLPSPAPQATVGELSSGVTLSRQSTRTVEPASTKV
jgi:hypothetical protein